MKYTIHYLLQEDGKYLKETRDKEGSPIGRLSGIEPKDVDDILETKSDLWGSFNYPAQEDWSLRQWLEYDAEYIEWLSQMCTKDEQDHAVVSIRKIIPLERIKLEPRVYG